MRGVATPFGRERGGFTAPWPAPPTRAPGSSRPKRTDDPWLDPLECQDGDTALEDLGAAEYPSHAARILARYFVTRVFQVAIAPASGADPRLERDAGSSYLRLLPRDDPDRGALGPFLDCSVEGLLDDHFVDRLSVAAATGGRHGLWRSTFALLRAGYGLALSAHRLDKAAKVARLLAAFVHARGAKPAARRWRHRAYALERRLASGRKRQ